MSTQGFGTDKWIASSLADWLQTMRERIQKSCGVTTQVSDQAFVLTRVVGELSDVLAGLDRGVAEALMMADPATAMGVALDVAMWRIGLRRLLPAKSQFAGRAFGVPGTLLNGELAKHNPTSITWQVGACEIGATGTVLCSVQCAVYGPVETPLGTSGTKDQWTRVSQTNGWTGLESLTARKLGRFLETDSEFRARGLEYLARGGGTEGAVWNAVASVSGVGAGNAQVYPNRTNDYIDGIPPHYLEAVVRGGVANEIAQALIDTASATAGFHGNTFGYAAHPQVPTEAVEIAFSRVVTRRVFARYTVKITGAENDIPGDFEGLIAALASQWGTPVALGGLLKSGVNPTSSAAAAYISNGVLQGTTVDVDVEFSFDAVTWFDTLDISKREDFILSNEPFAAEAISTEGPAYVGMTNGWTLVVRVDIDGVVGVDESVVFLGTEIDVGLVVARIAGYGYTDWGAAPSISGQTVRLYSTAKGADVDLIIRPATTDLLAFLLGFTEGTYTGRDTDIEVIFT